MDEKMKNKKYNLEKISGITHIKPEDIEEKVPDIIAVMDEFDIQEAKLIYIPELKKIELSGKTIDGYDVSFVFYLQEKGL